MGIASYVNIYMLWQDLVGTVCFVFFTASGFP